MLYSPLASGLDEEGSLEPQSGQEFPSLARVSEIQRRGRGRAKATKATRAGTRAGKRVNETHAYKPRTTRRMLENAFAFWSMTEGSFQFGILVDWKR